VNPFAAALAALPALAAAQTGGPPALLHEIELVASGTVGERLDGVQVELEVHPDADERPNALLQRRGAIRVAPGRWVLDTRAYPGGTDGVTRAHTAASFVVDFRDPAVARASVQADEGRGAGDTPARLRRFVHQYISSKNLRRGYDSASVVATRREGDCTEHAVLLTALARLRRLPARVVHGIVLVRAGDAWRAFGHAWVEVRQRKGWALLDSALESSPAVVYVPLSVLEDEGPGRALSLMGQVGPADVLRVRLTGPEQR
jgi:hypothetical protein